MNKSILFFMLAVVIVQSVTHIVNDNYFLAKQRFKRDATCPDGITASTRDILEQTIARGKKWECALESKAKAVINECLADNGGVTDGTLKLSFTMSTDDTPEVTIQQHEEALLLASSNSNSKSQATEFVGCSYAACEQRLDILCLYSRPSSTLPPLP